MGSFCTDCRSAAPLLFAVGLSATRHRQLARELARLEGRDDLEVGASRLCTQLVAVPALDDLESMRLATRTNPLTVAVVLIDERVRQRAQVAATVQRLVESDPRFEVIITAHDPCASVPTYRRALESGQVFVVARPRDARELAPLLFSAIRRSCTQHDLQQRLVQLEAVGASRGDELDLLGDRFRRLVNRQRRVELELRQSQKLEAIGQLAAGIAHEINTPIQFIGDSLRFLAESFDDLETALAAYDVVRDAACTDDAGSLAKSGTALNAVLEELEIAELRTEIPDALSRMAHGVERVARVVSSIRDFGRIEDRTYHPVDINASLDSALMLACSEYKQVADVVTEYQDLPLVMGSISEIGQVWLNLIINAAQAIGAQVAQGAERGRIIVRTRSVGNRVVVEIEDTGGGIPADVQSRIFEPFFTTKPVGQGTGQGLAISHSVIKRHRGKISVMSRPGSGTTFVVALPTNVEESAA